MMATIVQISNVVATQVSLVSFIPCMLKVAKQFISNLVIGTLLIIVGGLGFVPLISVHLLGII